MNVVTRVDVEKYTVDEFQVSDVDDEDPRLSFERGTDHLHCRSN